MSDGRASKRRRVEAGVELELNAQAGGGPSAEMVNGETQPDLPFEEMLKDSFDNFEVNPSSSGAAMLSLLDDDPEIRAFVEKTRMEPGKMSSEDMDAWTKTPRRDWPSNNRHIDDKFNTLRTKLIDLHPQLVEKKLAKTSGAMGAKWAVVWNYPVPNSNDNWAMTLDPANVCMNLQTRKIGTHRGVMVADTIVIRNKYVKDGVDWHAQYPKWDEMLTVMEDYTFEVTKDSRFVLVLGKENVQKWPSILDRNEVNYARRKIEPKVNGETIKIFRHEPECLVVRDWRNNEIQQLVFFMWHPQFFLYKCAQKGPGTCIWADLVWNALAEWNDVPILEEHIFHDSRQGYFERKRLDKYVDETPGKIKAFLATHQVKQLLVAEEDKLSKRMVAAKKTLLEDFPGWSNKQKLKWIYQRCVFWSKTHGRGLRFEGDRGEEDVPYEYEGMDDPRISFEPLFNPATREAFRTQARQGVYLLIE